MREARLLLALGAAGITIGWVGMAMSEAADRHPVRPPVGDLRPATIERLVESGFQIGSEGVVPATRTDAQLHSSAVGI